MKVSEVCNRAEGSSTSQTFRKFTAERLNKRYLEASAELRIKQIALDEIEEQIGPAGVAQFKTETDGLGGAKYRPTERKGGTTQNRHLSIEC